MKMWTCFLSVFALFFSSAHALEKKVEVERPYEFVKDNKGDVKIKPLPYLKRRPRWGVRLNFATSQIELKNELEPGKEGSPFQLDIGINKNFGRFSIGPEIGFTSAKFENTASFTAFSFGVGLYLDGISNTSYVVPFASIGGMSISGDVDQTNEEGEVNSVGIDTAAVVPYYRAGLLLGLNWIDKSTSLNALSDYGLQNSFLYFAVRQISSTTSDPTFFNLETTLYLEYGLQLEF